MQPSPVRRFIGTFHKSGTALFESILLGARAQGLLQPWMFHEGPEPDHWDIGFDYHTKRLNRTLERDPDLARYVICLRDPRDLVISATYYHAQTDEEAWLLEPSAEFGGMSYQEKINSYPSMSDRFAFEMEHSSYWQIFEMGRVAQDAPSVRITRLETLVQDQQLWEFHRIFSHLEFDGDVMLGLMRLALDNSLFSGKVPKSTHARSGRPAQYLTEWDDRTLARFHDLFGDVAERLGYPAAGLRRERTLVAVGSAAPVTAPADVPVQAFSLTG